VEWVVKGQYILLAILLLASSACSVSSAFTQEALVGTTLGTVAGTGVGYLIGDKIGKKTENMAVAGGVGAGLGLLAGSLLHERSVREAEERSVIIREVRMIGENQREIDELREKLVDSTTWGRGEVKPWKERYWGENYSSPYEGYIRH